MNYNPNLKENTKHGTTDFPIAIYTSSEPIAHQWHKEYEFIYIVEGKAKYNVNGNMLNLQSGDCAFCRGGDLHSMIIEQGKHVKFKALVFDINYIFNQNDICSEYFNKFNINNYFTPHNNKMLIDLINAIFIEHSNKNFGYELEIKSLIAQVFSYIFKNNLYHESSETNKILQKNLTKVIKYIHTHYSEKIQIKHLADLIGYSTSHFTRVFAQNIGKTPSEYIVFYRLYIACNLLKNSELSVSEISFSCGFFNINYFIRTFKKHYNYTPYQYKLKKISLK